MAKKLNSASRLHKIFEQTNTIADNVLTLEAWANLLAIDEANSNNRIILVGEQIHSMYREIDLIASGMEAADFSSNLYESALERVRQALSPMLFPNTWNYSKQYFSPEVLTSFAFCGEILPDEELQISDDELVEIKQKVNELKNYIYDKSLPPRLRKLIEHQISLIERALLEYPIAGAKVFREAGRTALGEFIEAKDEITTARDTEAVSKLESTWKKVNEAADIALKSEKIAQIGQRAWDAISNIF